MAPVLLNDKYWWKEVVGKDILEKEKKKGWNKSPVANIKLVFIICHLYTNLFWNPKQVMWCLNRTEGEYEGKKQASQPHMLLLKTAWPTHLSANVEMHYPILPFSNEERPPPNDNCLLQAEETFKLTNNTDSAHTGNTPLQLKHAFFL